MLQNKLGQTARLLDALYFYGAQPGQIVTEPGLLAFCKDHGIKMGEGTISEILRPANKRRSAFVELDPADVCCERFFPSDLTVLNRDSPKSSSPCNPRKKEGKKSRGRPKKGYLIPEYWQVFDLPRYHPLGLSLISFKAEDFVTIKRYRLAVYVSFIEQHPGTYTRFDLGWGIGLGGKATSAYDKAGGVIVTPQYRRKRIDLTNLHTIAFAEEPKGGVWLENQQHKKHPLFRHIAVDFIHQDGEVFIVSRRANHYKMPPKRENEQEAQPGAEAEPSTAG